jgi:hypothetical protein
MNKDNKLKWTATTVANGFETYELRNGSEPLVSLTLNQFSQTAKVECANSRRVFKIDKEGFLRHKTIIKNEYGVKIGQLGFDAWNSSEGFIDLNNERLYYTVHNNPMAELIIYKESKKQPLVVCGLSASDGNTSIHFSKDKEADKYSCLLMALCWFMFMPVAKENVVEYAA